MNTLGGFGGGHPHFRPHAPDPPIRKEWADCPGPSSSGCLLGARFQACRCPGIQFLAMALAAVLAAVEDLANRVRYASGTRVRQVVGRSDDQPQVRLGLSKETVSVPSALKVKWATSWKVMVLPSEPVAWAETVEVAFKFCRFKFKLSWIVICPVKVARTPTTVKLSSSVKVSWSSPVAGKNVSWLTMFEVAVPTAGLPLQGLDRREGLDPMEVLRDGHWVTRAAGGSGRGRGGCEPPCCDEREDSSKCQDSTTKRADPLLVSAAARQPTLWREATPAHFCWSTEQMNISPGCQPGSVLGGTSWAVMVTACRRTTWRPVSRAAAAFA